MSKLKPAILLGATCAIWIIVWTLFLSKHQAGPNPPTPASHSFIITDGNFEITSTTGLTFPLSDAEPTVSEDLARGFQQLADRLAQNPQQILTLTGIFGPSENNATPHQNLGQARAEAVKNILVKNGVPEANIQTDFLQTESLQMSEGQLTGVVLFSFSENKPAEEAPVAEAPKEKVPEKPIEKKPPPAQRPYVAIPLTFKNGDYQLDRAAKLQLGEIRDFLRKNPEKQVEISGYADPDEPSYLAEKRANTARRYLIDHGARRKQINILENPLPQDSSEQYGLLLVVKPL